MPKLKTKSGTKKRFRLTASGKIKRGQTAKRHGMIKRTNKQIRNQRGTTTLAQAAQAMEFGATSEDIAYTCHAHPTHSEAIKEAAMAVTGKPIHI